MEIKRAKPLNDGVMIRKNETLKTSIVLPDGVEVQNDNEKTFTVVDVGSKVTEVKSGDIIMAQPFGVTVVKVNDEELAIIKESEVVCVIEYD